MNMAKQTMPPRVNEPVLTKDNAQDYMYSLMLNQPVPFTFEQIMTVLESMDTGELEELTGEYFSPEIGATYNFICMGVEKKQIKGKDMEVAVLMDKNRKRFICGATVLVNNCKTLTTLPGYIRVTCIGKQTTSNGDYFDLEIHKIRQD